jgi:hypothetical protein
VADEDDVDMPVAADQEDVQQHEEALGQVLHRLGHRARHVHQAEHDRFGVGLRHALEPAVAHVERVDIGDDLAAPLAAFEQQRQPRDLVVGAARLGLFDLLAQRLELASFGRFSEMRRAMLLRMVRGTLRLDGEPVTV